MIKAFLFSFFTCCVTQFTIAQNSNSANLRLNQIQIIASHNSYKKRPDERVLKFLVSKAKLLGKENNPVAIDYGHLPFDSQFTYYNVRGLEIDICNDPKGGLFYKRKLNAFVRGVKQKSGIADLKKPGFKVLHIKDVDYETNYYTFKKSLVALKKWSDENPNHLPLFINIESKDGSPASQSGVLRFFGFKRDIPFDLSACDSIDAEIKSVFGDDLKNILTPDRLRGNFPSLEAMATSNAWPMLNDCRGKIIFIMEGGAVPNYILNYPSLKGRAVFVYSEPGQPEAAFVKRNSATRDKEKIKDLVKLGYIIRTRSDAETWEARDNDYTDFNNALEGGAQIISTDFYKADTRFSTFHVQFSKGEPGRANPIISTAESLTE
ncbi:MAG: Ca2+-dependent phosphoinositide-specific phospholipase C [Bacteroidota bacterium]